MKTIKARRLKASKFKPEDYISNMPDNVITNILNRLPLQEAVRTGILSRDWRFKWNGLSQLVFDVRFREYVTDPPKNENDYRRIISSLLLHVDGAITKFVVCIDLEEECYDLAQWILFLSRKGIKELAIQNFSYAVLELPTHLYSCLELKHLNLLNCCFDFPASFRGFPNMLSLNLYHIKFKCKKFAEFLTQCPMLEILKMFDCKDTNLKLVQIAKRKNLKILALDLHNLNNTMITSSSSIIELVGFLPKLHELHLDFRGDKYFVEHDEGKWELTTFPCLKTLELSYIDLSIGYMLSFAFRMITSSPSLQTLVIRTDKKADDDDVPPAVGFPELAYDTFRLLQLQSVEFSVLRALDKEILLIKLLLSCSPFLKKMAIHVSSQIPSDEKLKFATRLLELNRISPVAKINLS